MLFYVLVCLGACLAEPCPRGARTPRWQPHRGGCGAHGRLAHRASRAELAAPGPAEPPPQVPNTPCPAGRGAGLSRDRVSQPPGSSAGDCSHRCTAGSAGVIFLTFPHESCSLFRNPVANSLLWSSHLRWSDKYLPPVPGVLYFSHLTEQALPRRDL